ncbi:MAG: hypothetical protein LIR46_12850 [Bacteroidota bacterium]|nr:hypothetical protein [Bacteroidota bacterium]
MIGSKNYVIMVQLDGTKEAELVGAKEGYGHVNINNYTEDLYRNNKVQLTIPTRRNYLSAIKRSIEYSKMGILNCIVKV